MKSKLVILTGAGMSVESGLSTFRDSDGLWEKHRIEDVCTTEAWQKNPQLVLEFYNQRRRELQKAEPNEGHRILADLEQYYQVTIVTQNVDNLHERAGSKNVIHLHGELTKVRSSSHPETTYIIDELNPDTQLGDLCEFGSQLRPHIVFFGEGVPMIEKAAEIVSEADILVIIGTSLNVYPAAGLIQYAPQSTPIYLIDPKPVHAPSGRTFIAIQKGASDGMRELSQILIAKASGNP